MATLNDLVVLARENGKLAERERVVKILAAMRDGSHEDAWDVLDDAIDAIFGNADIDGASENDDTPGRMNGEDFYSRGWLNGVDAERERVVELFESRDVHEIFWTTTHGDDLTDSGCVEGCRACRLLASVSGGNE